MSNIDVQHILGNTDIYLIDQILKNRYQQHELILDAGCGSGRNLQWFLSTNKTIFAIDQNESVIQQLQQRHFSLPRGGFQTANVESLPFADNYFNHVISSAVLHFATGTNHFVAMFTEMLRVLRPGGSLFIRMASDIGIEHKLGEGNDGVFSIPDGSRRFLLTRSLYQQLLGQYNIAAIEPLKTVNVADVRCMSTLVFTKTF